MPLSEALGNLARPARVGFSIDYSNLTLFYYINHSISIEFVAVSELIGKESHNSVSDGFDRECRNIRIGASLRDLHRERRRKSD